MPSTAAEWLPSPVVSIARKIRTGFAAAAQLRKSALWNGLSVGIGIGCVTALGEFAFPQYASALMLGALCVSIIDSPVSAPEKLRRMSFAGVFCGLVTFASVAAAANSWTEILNIGVVAFVAAMVTGYGRSAVAISVSALLALVFAADIAKQGAPAPAATISFVSGEAIYIAYAMLTAPLLRSMTKRMLLRETLDALSILLRAQGEALARADHGGGPTITDAQANLAERIQAARDAVFLGAASERERLYSALLVVLIDVLEAAVSQQADLSQIAQSDDDTALREVRALLIVAARNLDRFSRSLAPGVVGETVDPVDPRNVWEHFAATSVGASRAPTDRLFRQIERLWVVRDDHAAAAAAVAGIRLERFAQTISFNPSLLVPQFHADSPVFRFAVRLSLAMGAGWLVAQTLPSGAHAIWILLTVALVMRANYSISKQRRDQRLIGNILGCGVAAVLLALSPSWLSPVLMFTAAGLTHALAVQSYLVASIASCVMALTLIHVAEPTGMATFFVLRIVDTAIGAAIAYGFSFILPSWERSAVRAQLPTLLAAARAYAWEALTLTGIDEDYRRARRRLFEATASLSLSTRRMFEEPHAPGAARQVLSELLNASYAFSAEMASLHLYAMGWRGSADERVEGDLARSRVYIDAVLTGQPMLVSQGAGEMRADPPSFERAIRAEVTASKLAAAGARAVEILKD